MRDDALELFALELEIFEMSGEALLARCMLHEIDHLNGILFLKHLSTLKRDLIKRKGRLMGMGHREYKVRDPRAKHLEETAKRLNNGGGSYAIARALEDAWNKVIAEDQQKNIEAVGMPQWSEDDQKLAKALQKDIGAKEDGLRTKVESLEEPAKTPTGGGSDDIGDISWNVPMVYLMYPANIPNLPGHAWPNAVAMATPIAHKGSVAGAKVQVMTALDIFLQPQLVAQAWDVAAEEAEGGVADRGPARGGDADDPHHPREGVGVART